MDLDMLRGKFQVHFCLIDFLDAFLDNFIEVIKKDNFIEVGMSSPTSNMFSGLSPRMGPSLLVGKFKLNFDGSTPRNTSMFGVGEIVRDKLASLITCSDIP